MYSNKPKKVNFGTIIFLSILVVFFIGFILSSDSDKSTVEQNINGQALDTFQENYLKADTVGSYATIDTVKTGNFAYKVHAIGYNKELGSNYNTKHTDGFYLLLQLYYTNISSASKTIDNSDFKLVDISGNALKYPNEPYIIYSYHL